MEQSHHRCLGGDHEPWGLAWLVYCIALQNAAYVKALGQIEIILSVMVGYFLFERKIGSAGSDCHEPACHQHSHADFIDLGCVTFNLL